MFEIFEENYDEPIQLSIISIICRGILKEVNLLGAKKEGIGKHNTRQQQSVIGSQKNISKNMSQQQFEDPCNLSADVYSAFEDLHP